MAASGVDTSRGINFQYTVSISYLLDFFENPSWDMIQFEGVTDVEDITVYDNSAGVRLKVQVKQKSDPNQWKPSEIKSILSEFLKSVSDENTQYHIVYAGAEGKYLVQISQIIPKLEYNNQMKISDKEKNILVKAFGSDITNFLTYHKGGVKLLKHNSTEKVEYSNFSRLKKILVHQKHLLTVDLEDYVENLYNKMFKQIARNTEDKNPFNRQISREQLYNLLGIDTSFSIKSGNFDIHHYYDALLPIAQKQANRILRNLELISSSNILDFIVNVEKINNSNQSTSFPEEQIPLLDLYKKSKNIAMVADVGGGKTTALWQIIASVIQGERKSLEEFEIPVYIDLSVYTGEDIMELIIRSISSYSASIDSQEVKNMAKDGRLTLLLDDFDLADTIVTSRLKSWRSIYPNCSLVIATHKVADANNLQLPAYNLIPLNSEQARSILRNIPGITKEDVKNIENGIEKANEHLLTSPLTVQMAAYVYLKSERRIPFSLSSLHEEVIQGLLMLSERKGYNRFDKSDKLTVLTLLAAWMQNANVFTISSATIGNLLNQWTTQQSSDFTIYHLKNADLFLLRQELINSGILRSNSDGNQEFIHYSFQNYLASETILSKDFQHLVTNTQWHNSLRFWVVTASSVTDLTRLLNYAKHYLILFNNLSQHRSTNILLGETFSKEDYFNEFLGDFKLFLYRFPLLIKTKNWKGVDFNQLQLRIKYYEGMGYSLIWSTVQKAPEQPIWIKQEKIASLVDKDNSSILWIMSEDEVKRCHPSELAFSRVIRVLYELIILSDWKLQKSDSFSENKNLHPLAIPIVDEYMYYRSIVKLLPTDLVEILPFYANGRMHISIDILEDANTRKMRYRIIPLSGVSELTVSVKINDQLVHGEETNDIIQATKQQVGIYTSYGEPDSSNFPLEKAYKQLERDLSGKLLGFPPISFRL